MEDRRDDTVPPFEARSYAWCIPLQAQDGDKIAVLFGMPVPFIIRRCLRRNHFLLIGECLILCSIKEELIEGF
jgi:hypothetical protein